MKCRFLYLAALPLILSACNNAGKDLLSTEPLKGEIKGKVVDAVLAGSTIQIFEWDKGEIVSNVIAETTTDTNGNYVLEPHYYNANLILKATGGSYIEEATGTQVDLQPGQELTALVRYEEGGAMNLNITVLTHWATCMAQWRAKTQSNNNSDAISLSYDAFTAMAGVAIREVEPLNITDPNNASPIINEGLQYGIYTAAISSLTKDMAERSDQSPHTLTNATSIYLAQIGCNDIRADGKLDGQGFTNDDSQISPLAFGTVLLTPRVYRTEVAQHMLIMASSDLNKSGLDATDYLNRAQSLSTMDSDVFDKLTPEPVDLDGPIISSNLPDGAFLKGTTDLVFTIDDPLGISKVEFYVDGEFVTSGSAGNTTFALDTTGFADGPHEVKVLAYDTLENEGTFVRNYNFDNSGPVVTVTSPTLVGNINYPATGTFQTDGAEIKTILVNGISAVLDVPNNTWSAVVDLASGNNTLVIQAEDDNGTFGPEVSAKIAVDTVNPQFLNGETSVLTSTGQNQYDLCLSDTMRNDITNAICIRDDRISLNGQVISGNLVDDSFVLIGYQVSDLPIDNIFTPADELVVEFKVEKDSVVIKDWQSAPAKNPNSANWYLPLTSEYLGDTWFQTSITSVFDISFRVTDQAGNSITTTYPLSFDVLPSSITMSTSLPNEAILKDTLFKDRSTIDGQNFNVEYECVNDSSVGYYLFLDDSTNHTVQYSYETAIRRNSARIKNEEQWFATFYLCEIASKTINCGSSLPEKEERVYSLLYFKYRTWGQIVTPKINYSEFQEVMSDTILVSDIPVQQYASEYACDSPAYNVYYAKSTPEINYIVCSASVDGSRIVYTDGLRIVNIETIEYELGFPKTVSTISGDPSIDIPSNALKVFSGTTANEIFPTNGWYLIPPATTARIIKTIRLPALIHHNDEDVADIPAFTSYAERRLDKLTTWKIDTDIKITRVVDPGDPAKISNQTPITQDVGEGIKTYTIGR